MCYAFPPETPNITLAIANEINKIASKHDIAASTNTGLGLFPTSTNHDSIQRTYTINSSYIDCVTGALEFILPFKNMLCIL